MLPFLFYNKDPLYKNIIVQFSPTIFYLGVGDVREATETILQDPEAAGSSLYSFSH